MDDATIDFPDDSRRPLNQDALDPDASNPEEGLLDPESSVGVQGDATLAVSSNGDVADLQPDVKDELLIQSFGDYDLLSEIARGGMGVVYRARQKSLNRIVALKMILAGTFASEESVRRFRFEAESAANLDHRGIVPIYDIGQHEDHHFFSMRLVEGESLAEVQRRDPLTPKASMQMVIQIADAVQHAHRRGILHRDLKPANILVDEDGVPVITDFGLARQNERRQQQEDHTAEGVVVGTPGFMSPEQARGESVSTAADVYSLTAILYNLVSGKTAHTGDTLMQTVLSIINDPPTPLSQHVPSVDRDLELICNKGLATDPDQRYQSAADLQSELQHYLDGRPLQVRPPSIIELARLWMGNHYGRVAWVPLIAVVAGIMAGMSLWFATAGGDAPEQHLETYSRFPDSQRPFMLTSWTIPRPIGFLGFCFSLMTIGWWTASRVKTRSTAADVGAGISVGLLTGFVILISCFASLSTFAGQSGYIKDVRFLGQLLESISPSDSTFVDGSQPKTNEVLNRIEITYPGLNAADATEASRLLSNKIVGDLVIKTISSLWLATLISVIGCGVNGLLQTIVAGNLLRAMPMWKARIAYICFGTGLVTLFFPWWCESSIQLSNGGYGYIIDYRLPLICAAISIGTICLALWRFPLWAQVPAALGSIVFFLLFLRFSFLAPSPPAVANARLQIAECQRAVKIHGTRSKFAPYLASAHLFYANALQAGNWEERSRQQLDIAYDVVRPDAAKFFDPDATAQVRQEIVIAAAGAALRQSEMQQAIAWARCIDVSVASQDGDDKVTNQQLTTAALLALVPDGEDQMIDFIGEINSDDRSSLFNAFRKLDVARKQRERSLDIPRAECIAWAKSLSRKLKFTSDNPQPINDPQTIESIVRWMHARVRWRVYGPFPSQDAKASIGLSQKNPIEDALLGDAEDQRPRATYTTTVHTKDRVNLLKLLGQEDNQFAYATTTLDVDQERDLILLVRSDDSIRVWIDGRQVHQFAGERGVWMQLDRVPVHLTAGEHRIVVQVGQTKQDWGFMIDAVTTQWKPLSIWPEDPR